jgi:hypothetical protein
MKFLPPVVFLMVVMTACLEEPDCLQQADTALIIDFKKLPDGITDTLIFSRIVAEGADSIFYFQTPVDKIDSLTSVTLAVNPYANETLFVFYLGEFTKRLKVGYQTETSFISKECGSEQLHKNLIILESEFDSVRVVNNVLTTERLTNLEIYR